MSFLDLFLPRQSLLDLEPAASACLASHLKLGFLGLLVSIRIYWALTPVWFSCGAWDLSRFHWRCLMEPSQCCAVLLEAY